MYSVFFWSVFSRIWTEYGEILFISPYSGQMRENTDQKKSKYGQFSRNINKIVYDFMNPSMHDVEKSANLLLKSCGVNEIFKVRLAIFQHYS